MIRKGVGAIIHDGYKFLLAQRIMIESGKYTLQKISPEWDIIKTVIKDNESPEKALQRGLFEETGSNKFIIEKKYSKSINFTFPDSFRANTGWSGQETTMFLVRYNGNYRFFPSMFLGKISFFDKNATLRLLNYREVKEFFEKFAP